MVKPKLPDGLHVVCSPGEIVIGAFEDVTIVDTCDKPTVSQWLDHVSLPIGVVGHYQIGETTIPIDSKIHIRIWDCCTLVLTTHRLMFLAPTQSADIHWRAILAVERQEGNRFAIHRKRSTHKRWLCFESSDFADSFEKVLTTSNHTAKLTHAHADKVPKRI